MIHFRQLHVVLVLYLLALGDGSGRCAPPDPSLLTLERIFSKREFDPKTFSGRWSKKGTSYIALEDSADVKGAQDIVATQVESGVREILVPARDFLPTLESAALKIESFSFSADQSKVLIYTNSKRVWRRNTRGDYWILDRSSHELKKLGGDAPPATLMFAKFSPSGEQVAYVRNGNIFVENCADENIRQVTPKGANLINGTFDWVYEEELSLRDGFRWSPDGRSIAFWQLDTTGVRKFALINNTDSLYPHITQIRYPKVGETNSACRIGVVEIATGKTTWPDVPGDPRNHYIARMEWAGNSEELMIQQLNRLQNTNRVLLVPRAENSEIITVLTERDKAWVNVHDEMIWFQNGKHFTWISERDGWRHIYLVSRTGDSIQLATPGAYDVARLLKVDEAKEQLFFIASPENPTQRYLYRVNFDGTNLQRVSPAKQPGTHGYRISPNAKWAIHTYSTFNRPPVTNMIELRQHQEIRVLENNKKLRKNLKSIKRRPTEFLRIAIEDDVELDGWCIKPPDFDSSKKYPLLIYVYGEPAGQTVLDRWGGHNALWHWMLAQRGYIVMSFDNRGTPALRGREWRKQVYRKVGILAAQDQAAVIQKVIDQRPYLDAGRVGVWGWSGGGSMSLNAIFKYPQLYKTAISIAPVPNQRFYDTIYQERYMGLPKDNVEGFLQGSPINYADQLQGNLLLIHGTADDNVHYQGSESLINELIRHNKQFSLMVYPNRTHSIREGQNTTLHLRNTMTKFLEERLTPGPRNP